MSKRLMSNVDLNDWIQLRSLHLEALRSFGRSKNPGFKVVQVVGEDLLQVEAAPGSGFRLVALLCLEPFEK